MLIKPCYDSNSNKNLSYIGWVFNKLVITNILTCKRRISAWFLWRSKFSSVEQVSGKKKRRGRSKGKMNFKRNPKRNFSLIALKQILNIKT